jgi:hypothetical protein
MAAFDVHRLERGANDAAGLGWRVLMLVLAPFCMATPWLWQVKMLP